MESKIYMVLLLLFAMLPAVSCAGDSVNNTPESVAVETTAPETAEKSTVDSIGKYDFEGYKYRVLGSNTLSIYVNCMLIDVELDNTQDIINSELYNRNRILEEKYNIDYTGVKSKSGMFDIITEARKTITAGSDDYDEFAILDRDGFTLAAEKLLYTMNDVGINLDNPWWDAAACKELAMGSVLPFAYGDDCLSYLDQTVAVLFNKKLHDDYALPDLYEMTSSGNWTLDKLYSMAQTANSDLDGNGVSDKNDCWGLVMTGYLFYPDTWISGGEKLVKKDDSNLPYFAAPGNERLFTILNKVYSLTEPSNSQLNIAIDAGDKMFTENKALFHPSVLCSISFMRAMDTDFGILPFPKFDEQQEKYYCRSTVAFPYVVPVTNTDLERTRVIMEARAALSNDTIIKAYYEISLKGKSSRDTESEAMLDIIYNNRAIDLGDTLWYAQIRAPINTLMDNKKNSYASEIAKIQGKIDVIMGEMLSAFNDVK